MLTGHTQEKKELSVHPSVLQNGDAMPENELDGNEVKDNEAVPRVDHSSRFGYQLDGESLW